MRKLVLMLVPLAAVLAAPPALADEVITVQIVDAVHFTPPNPQCPAGAGSAHTVVDGHRAGALHACFLSLTPTEGGQVGTGELAHALPGGRLVAQFTAVESFLSPTVLRQELTGTVTGATGQHRAPGTIRGGGVIDVEGATDLTFVVHLAG